MKKYIIVFVALLGLLYFVKHMTVNPLKPLPLSDPTPTEVFMEKIAQLETPGEINYTAVNKHGMLGRYQFSPVTIKSLGFNVTDSAFLGNPALQDSVMITYMKSNLKQLTQIIKEYNGKIVNGSEITVASLLAGAHFAGPTGVKTYVTSTSGGVGRTDSNGTSIKYYMSKFTDVDLSIMMEDL